MLSHSLLQYVLHVDDAPYLVYPGQMVSLRERTETLDKAMMMGLAVLLTVILTGIRKGQGRAKGQSCALGVVVCLER